MFTKNKKYLFFFFLVAIFLIINIFFWKDIVFLYKLNVTLRSLQSELLDNTQSLENIGEISYVKIPDTQETALMLENITLKDMRFLSSVSPDFLWLENCKISNWDGIYKTPLTGLFVMNCHVPMFTDKFTGKKLKTIFFEKTNIGNYLAFATEPINSIVIIIDDYLKDLSKIPILNSGRISLVECQNISDFSILKNQIYISDLSLRENKNLTNINFLKNLKHLYRLNINDTSVEDISLVKNLPGLKSLSYENTPAMNKNRSNKE